jgi:hypothetical protein
VSTTTFRNLRIYHKLKPEDINRTDINSKEDKYQDAVLANLEKKATKKNKRKTKKQKRSI